MTRMLDESGKFVGLDDKIGSYFWAEKYDGKFGKVVFGHESFVQNNIKEFPNAVGIDTGCVYGGWLTAMIIDENKNVSYISQKALAKYCEYGKK
jgi:diadenosine tetraphosphatase ApaH/serine/threonine PP2A family protein phosphatase